MEIVGSKILGADQHWELLPAQAVMAVRVGALCNGFQAFPAFPQWLGKQSTTGKMKRLTNEIVTHTALTAGQGFNSIRMEYVPYLRARLLAELKGTAGGDGGGAAPWDDAEDAKETKGKDKDGGGAAKCIEFLDQYGLSRDDFLENLRELQFVAPDARPGGALDLRDQYEALESKSKAAFTRMYNAGSHTSQALVSQQAATTGKKRRAGGGGDDDDAGPSTTEDLSASKAVEEEEDEDAVDLKAFAAVKKKPPSKAKAKAGAAKKAKK